MDIRKQHYKNRAEKLIKAMHKRQMTAAYFETSAEAVKALLEQIPEGSSVSWGGSVTIDETGLKEALKNGSCAVFDRDSAETPEEIYDIYHKALSCDYYIMSSNAISMDGELVNIDGRGNRLAALIYGPRNIIVLAGMNKVAETRQEALSRARNEAAPLNAVRLERNTPCAATGICSDCQSDDCICSHTVITRRSAPAGRIKVFLVGEALGF